MFFYVGTLFPVLGFMNAYGMRYSFVWDHWVYLPSLGIIALVAALVVSAAEFLRVRALVYGFAAIVLPVFTLLTWRQAGMYTDLETLWRTTLVTNPDCGMAHNNLGTLLKDQGHLAEAMDHYHKAIQINPNSPEALDNLGVALAAESRVDEAIESYNKSLQIDPISPETLNNLGSALATKGELDDAIRNYRLAIQFKPDFSQALGNLGSALALKGQLDEAIENLEKAILINPDASALDNLGVALTSQGRFEEALQTYHQALKVDSKRSATFVHLGMTLDQLGWKREAVGQYREALRLEPNQVEALNNLAWTLATSPDAALRNGAEAVNLAQRACDLTHYARPLFIGTLAAAYAESRHFDDAVASAHRARALAQELGQIKLVTETEKLLEQYKSGQAYRQTGNPAP
jgi:Flp pilus assembly protein TadD